MRKEVTQYEIHEMDYHPCCDTGHNPGVRRLSTSDPWRNPATSATINLPCLTDILSLHPNKSGENIEHDTEPWS
jgi:hypothetical protein